MPPVWAALGMAASYYAYPLLVSFSGFQYLLLLPLFLFAALISFLRVFVFYRREATFKKAGILVVAMAAGFSLGYAARRNVHDRVDTGIPMEKVTAVSGILREDPRSLQSGSGLGIVELRECSGSGGLRASARGRVAVFFRAESIPRLKEFGRGSELYLDGSLSDGGRGLLFSAVSVHVTKPAPAVEAWRTGIRTAILEKFQSRQGANYNDGSEPVWSGLASALLLGVRDDLNIDLLEGFRNSGCSHILALSGMHLALLSGALAFLIRRPLGVRWASIAGAVFIVIYVFIAGSQPSLVRAAIMYLLGTIAIWGLLKGRAVSFLSMAFIIQLIFQSDTGISLSFILSYLALAGILSLGETVRALFRGRIPEILNGSISASLGAFIITAPVVAYFFGSLKPIGIIAGLFLAPISSIFMILTLGALAAAFLPFPLWNIFDFLLTIVYRFLEFLISITGRVPGIPVSSPAAALIVSGLLWLLVLLVKRQDDIHRNSVASFN